MTQLFGEEPKWNTAEVEAQWNCPFCVERGETPDTRKRFRMNRIKLVGYCFNCGWKGNAVKFIRDFQKVSWSEAVDILNFYNDFQPLPQDVFEEVFDKIYLEDKELNTEKVTIPLPKDFKLLYNTKSKLADVYWKYAKKRGLTDRQIELHGVGFCPEGEILLPNKKKYYLRNRLIIQVFDDDNKSIYWMGRALSNNVKPKTFNPAGTRNSINKSDVIFNLNNAKKIGSVVITEGVFDATTVGDAGVALFGKTISVKQLLLLIKADLEAVYIMLDPDAFKDALKMADLISKHIKNTFICRPKGGDPNEIGKKGCLEAIKNAERYDKLTALKYLLLE